MVGSLLDDAAITFASMGRILVEVKDSRSDVQLNVTGTRVVERVLHSQKVTQLIGFEVINSMTLCLCLDPSFS